MTCKNDIQLQEKLMRWCMNANLEAIIKFHNEMDRLMNNRKVEINEMIESCDDKKRRIDLIIDKELYTDDFPSMLRTNIFLMMYSYLEEYLTHLSHICKFDTRSSRNSILERFRPVFKSVFNMDLGKDKDWDFICDCKKVRDCFLHANGRINLSEDKDHLENFIQRNSGMVTKENHSIVLTPEFLQKMNKTLSRFIDRIKLEDFLLD